MGFVYRFLLGCLIVLSLVNHAHAATPEQRLNEIVTQAAGKPASARCTFDAEAWDEQVRQVSFGQRRGSSVGGYTFPGTTVVYLGPSACHPLVNVFTGGVVYAGLYPTAFALLTVLHEAVHLRGVVDEGETDCTALGLFRSYLDDIGVAATVRKAVNVRGRYVLRTVVNPNFKLLGIYAQAIHNTRPLEYRGNC